MKPPKRARPVVAVLGDNMGSETTDFIIPWSVLTRSGVADVHAVGLHDGPIQMHPALKIMPSITAASFDAAAPDGPDYVIVPALHDPKSPAAIAWIKAKQAQGATIVSVCAGALVLAHADLLEGRAATTHWSSVNDMKRISPNVTWRQDRRYVADRGVVTTTGVSASLPMSLALVEAIAGRAASNRLAASLGVAAYDERHDSAAFQGVEGVIGRGIRNIASIPSETLTLTVQDGVDELALAFTADAWSRTYRSKCFVVGTPGVERIRTLNGLEVVLQPGQAGIPTQLSSAAPGKALDNVLADISNRYGPPTASFVAVQLEHPWPRA